MLKHYLPADTQHAWPIISQAPGIATADTKIRAETDYLPVLVGLWQRIEQATGYRWMSTSYWRDSPSHRRGEALDIAPSIAAASFHAYPVHHGSDPVLYKKTKLIRALQAVAHSIDDVPFSLGIYIEPDHLHLQVMKPEGRPEVKVFKWKQPKYAYADTQQRMSLPMTPG
jgi:hypothetical protein